MLFWIFVLIGIVSVVVIVLFDLEPQIGAIGVGVSLIAVAVSLFVMGMNHIPKDAMVAANKKYYESLIYQLDNNVYDNDNDLGKRDLYEDIQDWNSDLARYKKLQNNFWIGIYIPNIYDQFEFIEMK